jgi:hypothetical protein
MRISRFTKLIIIYLAITGFAIKAEDNKMEYPQIDNPAKEWCYLAKSTTVVGMPFMPDSVRITWDGAIYTRNAELAFFYGKDLKPVLQRQKTWLNGWIPIINYNWQEKGIDYRADIFNINLDGTDVSNTVTFARVKIKNISDKATEAVFAAAIRGSGEDYRDRKPYFNIDATYKMENSALYSNDKLVYTFSDNALMEALPGVLYKKPFNGAEYGISPRAEVGLAKYTISLKPGEEKTLEFKMPRVPTSDKSFNNKIINANLGDYYTKTVNYWLKLIGDKCIINVPEKRIKNAMKAATMHAILGTRTRNGERFQSDGIPYPNCFISALFDYERAYDCLGLSEFVEANIPQLEKRLQPDGMFLDTSLCHGKVIFSSHGQALMMIVNHIMFNRDKVFAEKVFPMIKKAVACIEKDHKENKYGLMRPSWPYDNEMISGHYTSHNLWCLAALRKSICVARLLGDKEDSEKWLKLHNSYEQAILKAIKASAKKDNYVPTGLYKFITGPKARRGFAEYRTDQDWDNSLLAWPTEVVPPDSPYIIGTVDRLRKTKYREGIMTYRNCMHLHQYNTVNTANQDIISGRSKKALQDIYHILLHSGSTGEGYENQVIPWGDRLVHGAQPPHAWGASKIAGLIRNMFILEHGGSLGLEPEKRNLYLFSVVSPAWAKPGETISVKNAPTEFGLLKSAEMRFTPTGANITIDKDFTVPMGKIIIRIPYFVKDVSFTTDAAKSERKGNAIYLSSDATKLTFSWTIDKDTDKTTYQDILLAYRREPNCWKGSREQMPELPSGFLTDEEKHHKQQPLSFDLVKEAFLHEYIRRYNETAVKGGKKLSLKAPGIITSPQKRKHTGIPGGK